MDDRGEWFDVFVTLIQYLLSGESKVGYLDNSRTNNPIHKVRICVVRASRANGRNLEGPRLRKRMRVQPLLRMSMSEKGWRESAKKKRGRSSRASMSLKSIVNSRPSLWGH